MWCQFAVSFEFFRFLHFAVSKLVWKAYQSIKENVYFCTKCQAIMRYCTIISIELIPSQRGVLSQNFQVHAGNIPFIFQIFTGNMCFMHCRIALALELCHCVPHHYHFYGNHFILLRLKKKIPSKFSMPQMERCVTLLALSVYTNSPGRTFHLNCANVRTVVSILNLPKIVSNNELGSKKLGLCFVSFLFNQLPSISGQWVTYHFYRKRHSGPKL